MLLGDWPILVAGCGLPVVIMVGMYREPVSSTAAEFAPQTVKAGLAN